MRDHSRSRAVSSLGIPSISEITWAGSGNAKSPITSNSLRSSAAAEQLLDDRLGPFLPLPDRARREDFRHEAPQPQVILAVLAGSSSGGPASVASRRWVGNLHRGDRADQRPRAREPLHVVVPGHHERRDCVGPMDRRRLADRAEMHRRVRHVARRPRVELDGAPGSSRGVDLAAALPIDGASGRAGSAGRRFLARRRVGSCRSSAATERGLASSASRKASPLTSCSRMSVTAVTVATRGSSSRSASSPIVSPGPIVAMYSRRRSRRRAVSDDPPSVRLVAFGADHLALGRLAQPVIASTTRRRSSVAQPSNSGSACNSAVYAHGRKRTPFATVSQVAERA